MFNLLTFASPEPRTVSAVVEIWLIPVVCMDLGLITNPVKTA